MKTSLYRRTIRDLDISRSVPTATIKQLLEALLIAPSSCNLHMYKVFIIEDSIDRDFLINNASKKFQWTNSSVLFFVDKKINNERDAQIISMGMGIQNFLLNAESEGISTIPIAGFVGDQKILKYFKLPKGYVCALSVLLGYRSSASNTHSKNEVLAKKSVDEILISKDIHIERVPTTFNLSRWSHSAEERIYIRQIRSLYFSQGKLVFYRNKACQKLINSYIDRFASGPKCYCGVASNDFKDINHDNIFETTSIRSSVNGETLIILPTVVFMFNKIRIGNYKKLILFRPKKFGPTWFYFYVSKVLKRHVYHKALFFRFGPWRMDVFNEIQNQLSEYDYKIFSKRRIEISPMFPLNGWSRLFFLLVNKIFGDWEIVEYRGG